MNIYNKFYLPTVYNIGFLGEGNYKPSLNGKRNKEYSLWQSMLQRCYDEKFNNRHIAYKELTKEVYKALCNYKVEIND